MRALVVNCSAPHYNLGAVKIRDWLLADGHQVTLTDGWCGAGFYALRPLAREMRPGWD